MCEKSIRSGFGGYFPPPTETGLPSVRKSKKPRIFPVLFLTASGDEASVVTGLNLGADDYITKPFSLAEVLARVRAALRRTLQYDAEPVREPQVLKAGDLSMNLEDYSVTKAGERIELTAKEFANSETPYEKSPKESTQKSRSIPWYGMMNISGDENAVNVHISRLRNKLEGDPRRPEYVVTVWGIGYKLGELS